MNELTFIPLKTADGQVAGHARVQDGVVGFRLRASAGTQALILTEGGYVTGETGAHIRAGGRVLCVALHERGKLRCCGFASGCPYTVDDVRARLITLFPAQSAEKPAPVPVLEPVIVPDAESEPPSCEPVSVDVPAAPPPSAFQAEPEPEPPPLTLLARERAEREASEKMECMRIPAAPTACPEAAPCETPMPEPCEAEPAPVSLEDACGELRLADVPDDAAADRPADALDDGAASVESVLERLNSETGAAFFDAAATVQETPDDTACRAEEFAALLARCERVFEKIAASPEHAVQPADERRPPLSAPRKQDDARRAAIDGWNDSVDALLAFPVAAAQAQSSARAPVRSPVTNPFPHIFPDARFYSECDSAGTHMLIGTWRRGLEQFTVTAVRGEYSPRPPEHLPGFTRYIRTRQGGFWVRVDD